MTTATSTPSCPEKTVVLFGAPRKNGVTGQLLERLTATATGEWTVIDCFARAVAPCDDCRACYTASRCAKHDMDDVYEAIERAERLVFLTPVYNRSFPAPMKAMIDRLQCYWSARFIRGVRAPIDTPKTAVLITVCGSDRDDGAHLLAQLEPQLTILHVTDVKAVHIQNSDRGVDLEAAADLLNDLRMRL